MGGLKREISTRCSGSGQWRAQHFEQSVYLLVVDGVVIIQDEDKVLGKLLNFVAERGVEHLQRGSLLCLKQLQGLFAGPRENRTHCGNEIA